MGLRRAAPPAVTRAAPDFRGTWGAAWSFSPRPPPLPCRGHGEPALQAPRKAGRAQSAQGRGPRGPAGRPSHRLHPGTHPDRCPSPSSQQWAAGQGVAVGAEDPVTPGPRGRREAQHWVQRPGDCRGLGQGGGEGTGAGALPGRGASPPCRSCREQGAVPSEVPGRTAAPLLRTAALRTPPGLAGLREGIVRGGQFVTVANTVSLQSDSPGPCLEGAPPGSLEGLWREQQLHGVPGVSACPGRPRVSSALKVRGAEGRRAGESGACWGAAHAKVRGQAGFARSLESHFWMVSTNFPTGRYCFAMWKGQETRLESRAGHRRPPRLRPGALTSCLWALSGWWTPLAEAEPPAVCKAREGG